MPMPTTPLRDLSEFTLDPEAITRLGEGFCRRKGVVVLGSLPDDEDAAVTIGMAALDDSGTEAAVRRQLDRPIVAVRMSLEDIARALDIGHGRACETPASGELRIADDPGSDSPVQRAMLDLLQRAIAAGATAVRVRVADAAVRVRIDGMLHPFSSAVSQDNAPAFAARITALAGLDLETATATPLQGRVAASWAAKGAEDTPIMLDISAHPGHAGIEVVVRIDAGRLPARALDALGLMPEQLEAVRDALSRPGVVLVVGPPGSGRTTTMYAMLDAIDDETRSVASLESHLGRPLRPSLGQAVVEPDDLVRWLNAVSSHDLDVVAIDPLDIAVAQATLWSHEPSGRTRIATLRGHDGASALQGLAARGLERNLLTQSLGVVLHQRLCRRVCPHCQTSVPADGFAQALERRWTRPIPVLRPQGCEHCEHRGYRGRLGVFELLPMDATARASWAAGGSIDVLRPPIEVGSTLWSAALRHVEAGNTTLDEVRRVLPPAPIAAATR